MSQEVLLRFLEAGVVDVGSDDTKLEKLRATVQDISAGLKKTPTKAVRWTLVACDPEISPTDPVIVEAWETLKKNWLTVANTYQGVPTAVLRAVLLDALIQTAAKDSRIAVAFVNAARNMLPFMTLGEEADVWRTAVAQIEDVVDARAESEWTTPEAIVLSPMAHDPPAGIMIGGDLKVTNRDTLRGKLLAAAGPTGGDNNPHWPQQNAAWAQEFANRMGNAVADAIDAVAKANAIPPVDLAPSFNKLASEVEAYVATALQGFDGATAGLQRRTNLLWWKEALYSPNLRIGYRDMDAFTAASTMALDLFEQVPAFSPASVAAFLNEAILLLPAASSADARPVTAIIEALLRDEMTAPLREVAKDLTPSPEGRRPLLAIVGHSAADTVKTIDFRQSTGLGEDVKMSPDRWGAHLFRELQALRATLPAPPKRSRRAN